MSLVKSNGGGLGGSGSPGGALGSFYGHTLDQSLRFNRSDNTKLHLDPTGSPTGVTKCTISVWFKRSTLGSSQYIFSGETGNVAYDILNIGSNDKIQILMQNPNSYGLRTDAVFRDLNAWYHLVCELDTTLSTAADRVKIYVNGDLQTLTSVYGNYPQDHSWYWSRSGASQNIGRSEYYSNSFDGYLAEFNFVDGQALDPTSFGETKDGVWIPKEYSGSHGNNGFYLPFANAESSGASTFFSDSGNSYVEFSNASHYDIGGSDDFTIEFFFNFTPTGLADYSYIFGYYVNNSNPFAIQYSNTANAFYFYYYSGALGSYGFTFSSGDLVAGKWHHLAVNRASGNLDAFLDGTRLGGNQTSNSISWDTSAVRIGQGQTNGSNGFDGYISNVRMVVGSAVYSSGSSITVPTSTLTAVTNTKLLALTTSTITADGSSNNVTGTVSGSGYFSTSGYSPFATYNFHDDQSGNTNNFIATNLFPRNVVPDSPTNNYALVNPLAVNTSSAWSVSKNNSKIQSSANNKQIRGNFLMQSGKWYWETRRHNANNSNAQLSNGVGIAQVNGYIELNPYQSATNWSYYSHTGSVYNNNTSTSYGDSWNTAGDIVGVAFDADNGVIWFSKNGTWQNSATASEIAAGTTTNAAYTGLTSSEGYVCVWWRTGGTNAVEMDINFGTNPSFNQELTGTDVGTESGDGGALFKYAPPTGFKALTTSNMPDVTITQGGDHFNTVLWTGNGTDGRTITGVNFAADWVWTKSRSVARSHHFQDIVRGFNDGTKVLRPNATTTESSVPTDQYGFVGTVNSDGYTLEDGTSDGVLINNNSETYVAWNWKAGGSASTISIGSISTGPDVPSIASSVSANTTAGFSIVGYTGTGSSGTIAHGLTSAPEVIFIKARTRTENWLVYHKFDGGTDGRSFLNLNLTDDKFDNGASGYFQGTPPTASVFYQNASSYNQNTDTYIAYCFHSVEGYSKVGSFVGNSDSSGTFVYLGFRPAWVLIKSSSNDGTSWCIFDNKRLGYNVDNNLQRIGTSSSATEQTDDDVDFVSNGLKFRRSSTNFNSSGYTYTYLAFAEAPFKFANAR